uniref:Uncharacterized protein n=1 Tax=Anguilla anguilla TaxID=7936 RepID=A0A0E9XRL0_ANGAN
MVRVLFLSFEFKAPINLP